LCEEAKSYATSFKNLANRKSGYNIYFEFDISVLNARDVFLSWYEKGNSYTYKYEAENLSETSKFIIYVNVL